VDAIWPLVFARESKALPFAPKLLPSTSNKSNVIICLPFYSHNGEFIAAEVQHERQRGSSISQGA
jgi:hypothetical protein